MVRALVGTQSEVYVMTGPLYEGKLGALPGADEGHRVPTGYWKIVCVASGSQSVQAIGFIFDQDTPRASKVQDHVTTIDQIENRSRLNFLWELPEALEDSIEGIKNTQWASAHFTE